MTNTKLQALKKKWVTKLELGPPLWQDIRVLFVDKKDIRNNLGEIEWQIDYSSATIKIANEDQHDTDELTVEETLIHELLHLRFEGHKDCDGKRQPHIERALNVVAKILVSKK